VGEALTLAGLSVRSVSGVTLAKVGPLVARAYLRRVYTEWARGKALDMEPRRMVVTRGVLAAGGVAGEPRRMLRCGRVVVSAEPGWRARVMA